VCLSNNSVYTRTYLDFMASFMEQKRLFVAVILHYCLHMENYDEKNEESENRGNMLMLCHELSVCETTIYQLLNFHNHHTSPCL
jgi:hypothetical protein